jgi:two-component system NtrC family sensor kinase
MGVPFVVQLVVLLSCMFQFFVPSPIWGQSSEPLRIGVYDNAPLSVWVDDNKPQGFFIDVWELIAKKAGLSYTYRRCALQECLELTKKGLLDATLVVADAPSRREFLDFPATAVFNNWAVVYTKKDLTIETILDLNGKKIAVETGDIHGAVFRDLIKRFGLSAEIVPAQSFTDVFSQIHKGIVDAGVVARTFGLQEEFRFDVRRSSVIFNPVNVSIAFYKSKHAAVISAIDRELPQLISDHNSAYHTFFYKWIGVGYRDKTPRWIYPTLGVFSLLLIFVAVEAYVFRRRLSIKTEEVKKKEARFRVMFEVSNDAMFVLKGTQFVECNAKTASLFGCEHVEELHGRSLLDFSPPLQPDGSNSAEDAQKILSVVLAGADTRFEWKHQKKDGTLFDASVSLSAFGSGDDRFVFAVVRDISKQKEYERQLLQTSTLLRRLLQCAPTPIIILDMENRVVVWSSAATKIYGWTEEEVYKKEPPYYGSPEERSRVYALMESVHKTAAPLQYESKRITREGNVLDMLMVIAPLITVDGIHQGMIEIHLDMTEQKELARKASESSMLLQTIVDHAPTPIVMLDSEYRVRMWNPAAERIYGWSKDDVIGSVIPYLSGDERARILAMLEHTFIDNNAVVYESRRATKNGDELFIMVASAPVQAEDGGLKGIIGVHIDITEQKRSQEEARYTRELFEKAFYANPGPMLIADASTGDLVEVNDNLCSLLGYHKDELLARSKEAISIYAESSDLQRALSLIQEHGFFRDMRVGFRTKNGDLKTCLWSGELVHYKDRDLMLSQFLDITDQEKLQFQLLQSQKMEAVGRFAGGIAHDFNNMLTAIIGYASFITDLAETVEKKDAYARQIIEAAHRAAGLTQSLLVFSRKQEADFSIVYMHAFLMDILGLVGRIIGEDVQVKSKIDESNLAVFGNAGQLGQVIINLATNARDAMPNGGKISIATRLIYVDDSFVAVHGFGKTGAHVLIEFSDTGMGIARNDLKRIFDPFFTTKETGKGTGLGLSIVYSIVKAHNGFIDVYSELGRGTTFKIYLPAVNAPAVMAEDTTASALPRGTETILIAEDDEAIRHILKQSLESAGYVVLACEDGAQARDVLVERKHTIAALLTDVIMPKLDGKMLADAARAIQPDIKILFLSGYTADILEEKMQLNCNMDILYKPIAPDQLLRKLREMLDRDDAKTTSVD